MKFADDEHRLFYETTVQKANAANDWYRQALFYTLGILPDTRRHINDIYDFKERIIRTDAIKEEWQTSGSMRVTRMAFNLYNGFMGHDGNLEIDDPSKYSPYQLFDVLNAEYFFEAVLILNGVYRRCEPISLDDVRSYRLSC